MDTSLRVYFLFEVFRIKNVWNTWDNISEWKNGHLKQEEPWMPVAMLGFKSCILSNIVTVICMEGSEDVLSTSVAAASGWAKVDTWPPIHDGCYHMREVGKPYSLWDLWRRLLFKIMRSLWNYCSYIVNISSLIFLSAAHLKKRGRKMILGLRISKVYVNCKIVCKFSEMLSKWSAELPNSDYFLITNISLTRDFVSICRLSMKSHFYNT
jgi:hypothetical protein